MALEASHIRFALDMKNQYKVVNLKEYLTGTLYPDSRFKTGVKRDMTHPSNFRTWKILELDDFEKGWYAHLVMDKRQFSVVKTLFPEIHLTSEMKQGDSSWIALTAVKIIEDLDDLIRINIKDNLPDLNYIRNVNGDDPELLREYYTLVLDVYSQPGKLNLDTYKFKAVKLGLSEQLAGQVMDKVKEFMQNPSIMMLVHEVYPKITESHE